MKENMYYLFTFCSKASDPNNDDKERLFQTDMIIKGNSDEVIQKAINFVSNEMQKKGYKISEDEIPSFLIRSIGEINKNFNKVKKIYTEEFKKIKQEEKIKKRLKKSLQKTTIKLA